MNRFLVILVLVVIAWGIQSSAESIVVLKSEFVAQPNTDISLYDLISEDSLPSIENLKKKLMAQVITRTQDQGERLELSTASLSQYLKRTLSDDEKKIFRFSLPKVLKIKIEYPELTLEQVEKVLKSKWAPLCVDCKIEISQIQLPIGKFSNWELIVPQTIPKGSFNIPIRVKSLEGRDSQYWLQGRVEVLKQVPVAQRALYVGERVRSEDIRYEWRPITFATDGAPKENQLMGMRLKAAVAANEVVWSRNLEREKALKRGDQVRVYSSGGDWELSILAIAQKDGDLGDTVDLKVGKSNKILSGVVTAQGEVEIK